jgi:hypothetical protein
MERLALPRTAAPKDRDFGEPRQNMARVPFDVDVWDTRQFAASVHVLLVFLLEFWRETRPYF